MEGAVEEFDDAGLLAEFDERVADHVRAQHREQFVGLACQVKRVGELERVLEIDVVVGEAVDEEERARELRGVGVGVTVTSSSWPWGDRGLPCASRWLDGAAVAVLCDGIC